MKSWSLDEWSAMVGEGTGNLRIGAPAQFAGAGALRSARVACKDRGPASGAEIRTRAGSALNSADGSSTRKLLVCSGAMQVRKAVAASFAPGFERRMGIADIAHQPANRGGWLTTLGNHASRNVN